ncbi:hypothetical protein QYE76_007247 [Lolium multiflorum]|uniref:Retrotransposon gag domain-containing protein n=1 Tax=Lolium multiflorum TaxID=4521 RepID=A0AAD8RXV9_LOLMU|nr:hypothetical protein QYE76_007247 [Lolium multiflorum]
MTFGSFHLRVGKEGSHRLAAPIFSGPLAADSDFSGSSSSSSIESDDEEVSPPSFIKPTIGGELADLLGSMSFGLLTGSYLSNDSDSVDNFDFINRSTSIREVFADRYDGVTDPEDDENTIAIYHQVYVIGESSRPEDEASEDFDDLGNPYIDPADLTRETGPKYVSPTPREKVRKTRVPSGFKLPDNYKKFDGLQDPEDWLVDYLETVKLMDGTRVTAMQSIQVHLSGAARSWMKKLPGGSIDTWETFEDMFVKNFRSTFKKPASIEQLRACKQKREKLEFEVIDFPSQYHALLGRPAYARFMAVPHYTYMLWRIPGPKGPITVKRSFVLADKCEKDFHRLSETFEMQAKYEASKLTTNYDVLPDGGRSLQEQAFDTSKNSKESA